MENDPAQNYVPPVPQPPAAPASPAPATTTPISPQPTLCPQCYLPVPPGAHFCPNCGKKLVAGPDAALSTSVTSQILLYGFSIVLPIIAFLAITKWQGIDYVKSSDPKAQQMGWIAIALIVISTVVTGWYAWVGIQQFFQAQTSTAGLSGFGL